MGVRKQVAQIAQRIYLVLYYEHNTNNSQDSTHQHRYNTANTIVVNTNVQYQYQCSKHKTLNCGGKKEHFEHNTTNPACIAHHYEHSKLDYKPRTATCDNHKPNSR